MRPERAKALIINAFALAGRFAIFNPYTQGAALGYELIGLYLFRYAPVTVGSARIIDISLPKKQFSAWRYYFPNTFSNAVCANSTGLPCASYG